MFDQLVTLLESLNIPSSFKSREKEENVVSEWNWVAQQTLRRLAHTLSTSQLDAATNAQVVAYVAALDGEDWFLEAETRAAAQDVLALLPSSSEVVSLVLERQIKPRFLSSPHPDLNLSTGRRLPHSAGGGVAAQDYYNEQNWKDYPGTANVILWCLRSTPGDDYERIWPLLIPPVMTFMDDYQAAYKLHGLSLVSHLLQSVPASLLKRTGVGQLLMTSLLRSLQMLHDDLTPELIRSAVPIVLRLSEMITTPQAVERFDHLCQVLGESIIGGVWVYASSELSTIEASMDVLPSLIHALGIGTVRYLKALIPQCVHNIVPKEFAETPVSLQISTLKVLLAVVQSCAPRMHAWKGAIIEGVGKCWISQCDKKTSDKDIERLSTEVLSALSTACPTVITDEYTKLLETEPVAFQAIIPVR